MNPDTGQIMPLSELAALRLAAPEEAAKFTVELQGPEEAIQAISAAVKEANRRKNKAARKARRTPR